ncbi:MAG: CheR family methyltransferase [Bacteroidales bacterium]
MAAARFDLAHVRFEGKERRPADVRRHLGPCRLAPPGRPAPAPRLPPIDKAGAGDFARWLLSQAGLSAGIYRPETLQRRVAAALRALKVATMDDARRLVSRHPERVHVGVSALLIGVTDFLRDAAVFDDIRATILPALAAQSGPLRVWSAACSSGEELYSLAILLAEAGLLDRTEILGTDCRADAIAHARTGVYPAASVASLAPDIRAKYLEPNGDEWRIAKALRERAQWKVADLGVGIEHGPWDLVLWRNVAIYLDPAATARIRSRLVAALRPGGFLVLGKAERVPAGMNMDAVRRCIYRHAEHHHVT